VILRPVQHQAATISDIQNIKERSRILIIYEHTSPHHNSYVEMSRIGSISPVNTYDFFLFNSSCVIGQGYVIPRGDVLHASNSYRGVITNPFLDTGKLNKLALVEIYQTYYNSRFSINGNMQEPIRLSSVESTGVTKLGSLLHNRSVSPLIDIVPMPIFYNSEDQAILALPDFKEINFETYQYLPTYTLAELVDDTTKVVKVELDSEFKSEYSSYGPRDSCEDTPEWILFETFSKLYEVTSRTNLKEAIFIFDTDDETFNIKGIRPQFTQTLTKTDMKLDLRLFYEDVSKIFDKFLENILYSHTSGSGFPRNTMRIYIAISETICKIKIIDHPYGESVPFIAGNIRNRGRGDAIEDVLEFLVDW
jgi:hypothetical protein